MTTPHEASVRMSERALLEAVQREEVSWRRRDGVHRATTHSYRRWTNEHDYVLVTRQVAKLHAAGFVALEMAAGYTYVGKGPVVLTAKGRAALRPAAPGVGE